MTIKKLTSRESCQDTSGAKTFADQQRLSGNQPGIIDRLGEPNGVQDARLEHPISRDQAKPAGFD